MATDDTELMPDIWIGKKSMSLFIDLICPHCGANQSQLLRYWPRWQCLNPECTKDLGLEHARMVPRG